LREAVRIAHNTTAVYDPPQSRHRASRGEVGSV